jgi:mono/diheme cytochrome c family protein
MRVALICLAAVSIVFAADDPIASQAVSILQQRCAQCHSEKVSMSGLQLSSREALLKGGTRGPALKPGNVADSLLIAAIEHRGKLEMPPGRKLAAEEVAALRTWVEKSAPWPETTQSKPAATTWWAFRKPVKPTPPQGSDARTPIDAFIVQKLREKNLTPATPADGATLIKRATYDLLGLPPTQEQIQAFVNDKSPDAWEKLVDSLLASPRYGEKWGQHWLDLVRYGDTSGFEQDPYTLEAWRYRDYVMKSLNSDKPYDRFVQEQIAGDELWPDDPEARTGTGYYRVGTNRDMLFKVEDLNREEKLTDYVDTTGQVFLGLTVGCARCHDHKFDPIPQRDFYRMQAIFAPAVNDRVFLEYNSARFYDIAANSREFRLRQIGDQLSRILTPYREKLRKEKIAKLGAEEQAAFAVKAEDRTPAQQAIVTASESSVKVADDDVRAILSPTDKEVVASIEKRLVSIFTGYTAPPMAPGVIDVGREAPRTFIALRGNAQNPGEEVGPGFLTCVGGGNIPDPPLHAKTTGRRRALAEWMANKDNPLFARVMVNRIWQGHFGTGLVRTPSDFGTRAGSATHPELLDWLAAEFADRKFSIKAMHRLIMTSDVYMRSAEPPKAAAAIDPTNQLLSHFNRRRLAAEEIRDAMLQVSGQLNLKMGGAPAVPPLESEELFGIIGKPENAWMVTPDPSEHVRRSVYLLKRRTFQQPMMEAFDAPDGVLTCSRRNESTTAPQSLALLNSRFSMEQAKATAEKVSNIEDAWNRVLGRAPTAAESSAAQQFVQRQEARLGSRAAAMTELTRSLLNTNEFLYVE